MKMSLDFIRPGLSDRTCQGILPVVELKSLAIDTRCDEISTLPPSLNRDLLPRTLLPLPDKVHLRPVVETRSVGTEQQNDAQDGQALRFHRRTPVEVAGGYDRRETSAIAAATPQPECELHL